MDLAALLAEESAAALASFRDRPRAERLLERLVGLAGSPPAAAALLDAVLAALPETADSDLALLNLERWASQLSTPTGSLALLREDPRLLADLLALFGASRYLSDILVRDPWLYSLFLEPPAPRSEGEYASLVEAALRPLKRPESRRDALRRVKRREFLRLGWRDLARRAPLEELAREISDLADALVAAALRLASEEVAPRFPTAAGTVPFAVVGMGKLGARELNYSSDIDLVFIMHGPDPHDEAARRYATRVAETLIQVLAQETGEGRCFRVDMRLRPEGRSGAVVRSYAAFHDYYDRWAETWERQALIKARPVAGDAELGERFMALVRPVAYRRLQGASLLEDVREMRQAVERKLEAAGSSELHVKEGRGTIRDVEFTVQLLQLLFAAERPELQARDTFTALERLRDVGLLTADEHEILAGGYRFFREAEHRLQLLHDLPVRVVPTDPHDLRRLARTMGFEESGAFLEAYRDRSGRVRALVETIYHRLGVDLAAPDHRLRQALLRADAPESVEALREEFASLGHPAAEEAGDALARLAAGPPGARHPAATRRLFADVAPALLAGASAAADPARSVQWLADLADRKLLHRALYQTWQEHPGALGALARFGGGAPAAGRVVLKYPELSDLVSDEENLAAAHELPALQAQLAGRLADAATWERRLSALRRFKLRQYVRLAAREVLVRPEPEQTTAEWSDTAEAAVAAALALSVQHLREAGRWPREDAGDFALFALGRFGGRDLHFSSDLDLLYVHGSEGDLTQQQYELLAKTLGDALQLVTAEGRLWELDLRLRPEGRQGFTVASLEGARRYYGAGGRAQTWEYQTLTRLRFVAGSTAAAAEFRRIVEPEVYRQPMPETWRTEIRHMKRRMEAERASEADRSRNLKLGPGGLSDVEFLTQVLQLRHGGEDESLRVPGTREALHRLGGGGYLPVDQVEAVLTAQRFLTRLRQSLALLQTEGSSDLLPDPETEPRMAAAVSRMMGYEAPARLLAAFRERASRVRELFVEVLGTEG